MLLTDATDLDNFQYWGIIFQDWPILGAKVYYVVFMYN